MMIHTKILLDALYTIIKIEKRLSKLSLSHKPKVLTILLAIHSSYCIRGALAGALARRLVIIEPKYSGGEGT